MKNGTFIVYAIQQRKSAEGPWLELDKPIKPVKTDDKWGFIGDNWYKAATPYVGTGNDRRPRNEVAYKEWHATYQATEVHGWFDIRFAIAALKRCRSLDAEGEYDYRDGYSKLHQRIRHEYRIVTVRQTFNRAIEPVSVEDLVETMV